MSKVSIVECHNYELEEVKRAIAIAVEKTDFPDVTGKKVLLKPNILSDAAPEKAITTHPVVLQAVIQLIKEKGAAEIYVGDSPALQKSNFRPTSSGIWQVVEEEKVQWVDFTDKPVSKKLPIANHSISMAKIIDYVDLSISLSKFKTHEFMYLTGSMKNMFGLVPTIRKSAQHMRHPSRGSFAKMLCGLMAHAKVEYTFMDAIVGMEGAGPANGSPRFVGKIIAGHDPLAVDIAEATMMGYDPLLIPIIQLGLEYGVTGLKSIDEVIYPLYDARDLIMKDYKRIGKKINADTDDSDAEYLKRATPKFNHDTCILCEKCANICPATALTITDGQVMIDDNKCIRCYCCNEVCPVNAITVEV